MNHLNDSSSKNNKKLHYAPKWCDEVAPSACVSPELIP